MNTYVHFYISLNFFEIRKFSDKIFRGNVKIVYLKQTVK